QALERFPSPAAVHVIFTAHSLPQRILQHGDPYPEELLASARAVARDLRLGAWHFAFQSAGASPEPWLGPDAGEVVRRLAGAGAKDFLIVPIGFVCDHVEILYDIDVEYRQLADRLGVRLERTASLNDDPLLIEALADIVRRAAAERGWM
ncbi:MAG TPA: ferrochelatase, partial [Gemmatimonadales bacterium]|nr:ferrochelatase [Gemmatimonadales bacterium]